VFSLKESPPLVVREREMESIAVREHCHRSCAKMIKCEISIVNITYLKHVENGFIGLYLKQDTAVRGYPVWCSVLIYCILSYDRWQFSPATSDVGYALRPKKRCDNIIMSYGFSCRHTAICASLLQTFSLINRYRVFRMYDIIKCYFSIQYCQIIIYAVTRLFSEYDHPHFKVS